MHLHEALAQISEIRRQVDRTTTFRGYRSATIGLSGLIAIVIAGLQSWLVPVPTSNPVGYLQLWVGVAILSVIINGVEMWLRCLRSESPRAVRQTLDAVEQFVPSTIAGALTTLVLFRAAPESVWMLPGLWGVFFSLGIFASVRQLPRSILIAALYYLGCGLSFLASGQGALAFSPWAMGVTFGGGQILSAAILYYTLECEHAGS